MINLLRFIYRIYKKPLNWLGSYYRWYSNFICPNLFNLLPGRIVLHDYPSFNQLTLCEGAGIVEICKGCSFGYKLGGFHRRGSIELQARYKASKIKIGSNISTNNNIMICAANYIEIGDDCLIGNFVSIRDHEAHGLAPDKRREIGEIGIVKIERNVWIGNNVLILKNTHIGENTIIAAGAVVAGNFPPDVIIGGVPAKIIKPIK